MTSEEVKIRKHVFMGLVEEFFEEMHRVQLEGDLDKERIEYLMEQFDRGEQREIFKKPNVIDFLKDNGFRYELGAHHSKALSSKWDSRSVTINGKKKAVKFF